MSERHSGDAAWLSQTIWNLYSQRSPFLGLWVGVDQWDNVTAHLVATVQLWDGGNVAWVHQLENNAGPLTAAIWDKGMSLLKEWVVTEVNPVLAKQGVSQVRRFLFSTPHDPRFFERRAGFTVYRHLMERGL